MNYMHITLFNELNQIEKCFAFSREKNGYLTCESMKRLLKPQPHPSSNTHFISNANKLN